MQAKRFGIFYIQGSESEIQLEQSGLKADLDSRNCWRRAEACRSDRRGLAV